MEMTIIFKDETRRFKNYIGSYEFIGDKMLKVSAHSGDKIYTEIFSLDEISKICIEEDAREFERRIKINN